MSPGENAALIALARPPPELSSRELALKLTNTESLSVPADASIAELAIADFERFGEHWKVATPEEKHQMLECMVANLYVELVPGDGFRPVLEGAAIAKKPASIAGLHEIAIGDPERIRTADLRLDRAAC